MHNIIPSSSPTLTARGSNCQPIYNPPLPLYPPKPTHRLLPTQLTMAKKKKNHDHNNEGGEKQKKEGGGGDGEKKKEEKGPMIVVLKVDMHCEGCASKIVRCVRHFDGVDSAKPDISSNKLTIVGSTLDPSKIRDKLHEKTKKRVDLISPQIKKDKENDDPKPDNPNTTTNKKPEEKKPKEPPVTTAVLKMALHCQGCIEKIQKVVWKFKGVENISVDKQKDLVTVKGTMDVKALTESLKDRLKRPVEIVPPKKDKDDKESNGGDNNGDGGGKKKKKKGGGGGDADGDGGGDGGEIAEGGGGGKMEGNRMEYWGPPGFGHGYGYGFAYPAYYEYPVGHMPAPQIFSDENPNACSVM